MVAAKRRKSPSRALRLAVRTVHPDEHIYPFRKYWRRAFERDAGLRIDHLLLSPPLAGRLLATGVARDIWALEKTADHAPGWIGLAPA